MDKEIMPIVQDNIESRLGNDERVDLVAKQWNSTFFMLQRLPKLKDGVRLLREPEVDISWTLWDEQAGMGLKRLIQARARGFRARLTPKTSTRFKPKNRPVY